MEQETNDLGWHDPERQRARLARMLRRMRDVLATDVRPALRRHRYHETRGERRRRVRDAQQRDRERVARRAARLRARRPGG